MSKPVHAKPALYALYYADLKEIALKYGYNLVLHGSLNRDLDLIAIPWQQEVGQHTEMVEEFAQVLGGYLLYGNGVDTRFRPDADEPLYSVTHHGRLQYVININRECEKKGDEWVDPQYYLDISVIPTTQHP